MISLPPEPQNHWTLAWWISGVVTFIGLMWTAVVSGLTNWIKKAMWDRIFKKRQEQILTERERAVTNGEFDTFKVTTAGRMDELSRVTHAAAADMTDAANEK
jgi:hypothetical protein